MLIWGLEHAPGAREPVPLARGCPGNGDLVDGRHAAGAHRVAYPLTPSGRRQPLCYRRCGLDHLGAPITCTFAATLLRISPHQQCRKRLPSTIEPVRHYIVLRDPDPRSRWGDACSGSYSRTITSVKRRGKNRTDSIFDQLASSLEHPQIVGVNPDELLGLASRWPAGAAPRLPQRASSGTTAPGRCTCLCCQVAGVKSWLVPGAFLHGHWSSCWPWVLTAW